jgi:NitT/TauT family transport system substrate-binding protein
MGSLNMVFGTHRDVISEKPDLVRVMLGIHQRATEFAATKQGRHGRNGVQQARTEKEAIEASRPNVELMAARGQADRAIERSTPTTCWR